MSEVDNQSETGQAFAEPVKTAQQMLDEKIAVAQNAVDEITNTVLAPAQKHLQTLQEFAAALTTTGALKLLTVDEFNALLK